MSKKKAKKLPPAFVHSVLGSSMDDEYKLSLQIGTETYKSKGATVFEALRNLKKPDKILLKGLLTIEQGNMRRQQLFHPRRLKRLFYSSPAMQMIQAKQIMSVGLKPVK